VLNTDAAIYGGGNIGNLGSIGVDRVEAHGRTHSVALTLPPLAVLVLMPEFE
jgi:1,4-alpha-glucan branching enzyme